MPTRTISPDDLARLKTQREEADRRYNEALTALDRAVQRVPEMPHPPPPPDEHQVTPLNARWELLATPPALGAGWRGRLGAFVWRIVSPYLERQQAFNSALVDHLNRNIRVQRETRQAIASTIDTMRERLQELVTFQSTLVAYLQQVTPYVDTKDYEFEGLGRRLHEDDRELIEMLDQRSIALGGAISGVGDELARRWESMVAREQRYEARTTSLGAAHEELRGALAIVQQVSNTLRREVDRLSRASPLPAATGAAASGAAASASSRESSPGDGRSPGGFEQAQATGIDSYKYVGFEDRFRGSPDDIRARLEEYLPYFEGASDVLDLGCGRGEFLDLLTARRISCRGLDLNHEMVEVCRARGLHVDEADALGYLQGLPDGALGGILAAQVVEHLQPDYLLALIDAAWHKLRPGSRIVLETINPACWFAFFASYIRDITHVRPLHPDTLGYFVQASGFQRVTVRYRAPYPEHEKLQPVPPGVPSAETLNSNVERLNSLMFTYLDYAVIGERL
jgi:SAM-dependent methyltransferase